MKKHNFVEIKSHSLLSFSGVLEFDVYVRLSQSKFTKVFHKGTELELERVDAYLKKGINSFYVLKEDRRIFLHYHFDNFKSLMDSKNYGSVAAQQILNEMATQTVNEIFEDKILDEDTSKITNAVVDTYVDIAKIDFSSIPKMLAQARNNDAVVRHAITTALFSILLAQEQSPNDLSLMFNCGLAGFLHDLGQDEDLLHIDEFSTSLSKAEANALIKHTVEGTNFLPIEYINEISIKAVKQHHEAWDGSGFPEKLQGEEISLVARILSIADQFSTQIARKNPSFALSPSLIIMIMKKNPKLDPMLVELFAKMLKV